MTGLGEFTVRHAPRCGKQAAVRVAEFSKQALFFRDQTPILISHVTRVEPVHPSEARHPTEPQPQKICVICAICGLSPIFGLWARSPSPKFSLAVGRAAEAHLFVGFWHGNAALRSPLDETFLN
jgi:hypothetical protein